MVEPEQELARKVLRYVPLTLAVAFSLGMLVGGAGTGSSAAIGVAVVEIVAEERLTGRGAVRRLRERRCQE